LVPIPSQEPFGPAVLADRVALANSTHAHRFGQRRLALECVVGSLGHEYLDAVGALFPRKGLFLSLAVSWVVEGFIHHSLAVFRVIHNAQLIGHCLL
jgi:hypothetical protein